MARPDGRPWGRIVIACAPGDAIVGARLAKALADAGRTPVLHQKSPSLKVEKDAFDAAEALVVVWSRRTGSDAGLVREASAAAARGRLVLARIDAARPPAALSEGREVRLSPARPERGADALVKALPTPSKGAKAPARRSSRMNASPAIDEVHPGRDERSTWRGTLLLIVLMGAIAWTAHYVVTGRTSVDVRAIMSALRV